VLTRKDLVSGYKLSLTTNGIEINAKAHTRHCDLYLGLITDYIKQGHVIRFQGCGAIVVRQKKERAGFNPRTGERHMVSGRRTCSMIRTVRSSAKGIMQEKKITTKQMRLDLGRLIDDQEAAEAMVNTFLRLLQSISSGREEKLKLTDLGTFTLRKTINEGCVAFSPSRALREHLKAQR